MTCQSEASHGLSSQSLAGVPTKKLQPLSTPEERQSKSSSTPSLELKKAGDARESRKLPSLIHRVLLEYGGPYATIQSARQQPSHAVEQKKGSNSITEFKIHKADPQRTENVSNTSATASASSKSIERPAPTKAFTEGDDYEVMVNLMAVDLSKSPQPKTAASTSAMSELQNADKKSSALVRRPL